MSRISPCPGKNSIASVFVVKIDTVRSQVGVSAGQAAENAHAAFLAHQAGYDMVTLNDPGVVGSVTSYVGPIKVVRVGTISPVDQVTVPPMVIGGIGVPAIVHVAGGSHGGGSHGGGSHGGGHSRIGTSTMVYGSSGGKLASFGMQTKR